MLLVGVNKEIRCEMLRKNKEVFFKVFACSMILAKERWRGLKILVGIFAQGKKSSIAVEGAFCISLVVAFILVPLVIASVDYSNSLLALRLADTLGMSFYNGRSMSPGFVQNIMNQVLAESGVKGVSAIVMVTSYVSTANNSPGNTVSYYYGDSNSLAYESSTVNSVTCQPYSGSDNFYCSVLSSYPMGYGTSLLSSLSRSYSSFLGNNAYQEYGSYLAQGDATVEVCIPSIVFNTQPQGFMYGGDFSWWYYLKYYFNLWWALSGMGPNSPNVNHVCGYMGVMIPGTPQQVGKYLEMIKNIPNYYNESSNGSG